MKHNQKVLKYKKKETIAVPELLLPAGNPESFMAAITGGADAIYFGLDQFSARNRARNFHIEDIPSLAKEAQKREVKLYVALNTLIKNNEIKNLLKVLLSLENMPIAALIIQDWGVYYLIKKYFPNFTIHSSTQMGNHNSLDSNFSHKLGFQRIILARELALEDLQHISKRSKAELELFIHGALCYSFSGYCLMSSFIGGNSANRGLCRQPCRQVFKDEKHSNYSRFFCMKDFQLIDYLPQICEMGIKSLKIEGRMRSPEYVYQVARAYRMALDDFSKIPEAKKILEEDGGREKTSWKFADEQGNPFTERAQTAIQIGRVLAVKEGFLHIFLSSDLKPKTLLYTGTSDCSQLHEIKADAMFILTSSGLKNVTLANAGDTILIKAVNSRSKIGDEIFRQAHALSNRFAWQPKPIRPIKPDMKKLDNIHRQLSIPIRSNLGRDQLFFRISDPKWLPILSQIEAAKVLCPLSLALEQEENLVGLIPETPLYASETSLRKLQNDVRSLQDKGYTEFSIARLSHLDLFDRKIVTDIITNEYIYTLNDASIAFIRSLGIKEWVLPLENDYPNTMIAANRNGIIPLLYHPPLFLSVQKPVPQSNVKLDKEVYKSNLDGALHKLSAQKAVCLFGFLPRLRNLAYRKYLIDLSLVEVSEIVFGKIMEHYESASAMPDTTTFNFKKGLH